MATVAFSKEQLTLIGAIAMTYNDAEQCLLDTASLCIGYVGPRREIISRINGVDGVISIVKATIKDWKLPDEALQCISTSLGGFADIKRLRDATIHARMHNSKLSIGLYYRHRAITEEVLLSVDALARLHKATEYIHDELDNIEHAVMWWREIVFGGYLIAHKGDSKWHATDDRRKESGLRDIQASMSRCLRSQNRRLSLRHFPKFPEAPQL